jgi:hypothetical protein
VLFSVAGAIAKWLGLSGEERQKTLIAEAATAAFAGGLVFCLYAWLAFNMYLAFALSGLMGWIGAKGIDMLGKVIVKHSGINGLDQNDKEEK